MIYCSGTVTFCHHKTNDHSSLSSGNEPPLLQYPKSPLQQQSRNSMSFPQPYFPGQSLMTQSHLTGFLPHDSLLQDADPNSPDIFRRNVSLVLAEVQKLQVLATTVLSRMCVFALIIFQYRRPQSTILDTQTKCISTWNSAIPHAG